MRRLATLLLLGVFGIASACAEKKDNSMKNSAGAIKVTREYLLAHGFKGSEDPDMPDVYELEKVRLRDVARDLGFAVTSLKPVPGQSPDEDVRTVVAGDIHVMVENKLDKDTEEAKEGKWVFGGYHPLDNPDSICNATVILKKEGSERNER
jgi:hypothetical protein